MKKKLFFGLALLSLAAVIFVKVNSGTNAATPDLFVNVEALAQDELPEGWVAGKKMGTETRGTGTWSYNPLAGMILPDYKECNCCVTSSSDACNANNEDSLC